MGMCRALEGKHAAVQPGSNYLPAPGLQSAFKERKCPNVYLDAYY